MKKNIVVLGSTGQLAKAYKVDHPNAKFIGSNELNFCNLADFDLINWSKVEIIINCVAYTNVDEAETNEGRVLAWQINANAVKKLTEIALKNNILLVHISSDYVFDGLKEYHSETEVFSPLGVYGQTKAAADLIVSILPKHYILRTSWVIGDGNNFIKTMLNLGKKNISPKIVNDQIGRLSFTSQIVKAIDYLMDSSSPYGTYNISNSGESVSWFDIAKLTFKIANFKQSVYPVSTNEYYSDASRLIAPRPLHSTLNINKIKSTGFMPRSWRDNLTEYIKKELEK